MNAYGDMDEEDYRRWDEFKREHPENTNALEELMMGTYRCADGTILRKERKYY